MKNIISITRHKAFTSLVLATLGATSVPAQVFNPTTTSEITYPATSVGPLAVSPPPPTSYPSPIAYAQVPGLYCNAHESNTRTAPGEPGQGANYIAETASWTVSNASGWEDGYFTYGYTDGSGVYIPVGTESIPGAKHLSVAYMTDISGMNAYVIAAYTIRRQSYNNPSPCVYTPYVIPAYEYAQEYRIYDWPAVTSPVAFARMGRVSNISAGINPIYNLPACHPEYSSPYSLWTSDFAWDGNIVMDVNVDAKRVAFAWTGNGGATQLSVASINSATNPATLNISTPTGIAGGRDPLDIAFRRDPSLPSGPDPYTDFIHTLENDGTDRYYVIQNDYNSISGTGGHPQLQDDATYISTMLTGTSLFSGRADQIKLDVPDVSPQRRWAYTWSDGRSIRLRRYVAPFSLAPSGGIASSTDQIINDGSLLDMAGNIIDACNTRQNIKAAIAYKGSSNNIYLAWLTDATIGSPTGGSGFANAVSLELADLGWPTMMRALSTEDYLHVQTNNLMSAREYVSLSHHSFTTNDYLYNCFTADDGTDNYLLHKNHNMTVATAWRTPVPATIKPAATIKAGPNPFRDVLQLQGSGILEVQLSDITGRRIATFNGSAGEINPALSGKATQLIAGIYILSVKDEQGLEQTFKLSKQ